MLQVCLSFSGRAFLVVHFQSPLQALLTPPPVFVMFSCCSACVALVGGIQAAQKFCEFFPITNKIQSFGIPDAKSSPFSLI